MTVHWPDAAADDWKPLRRLPQRRVGSPRARDLSSPMLTVSSSAAGPSQPDRKLIRGYLNVSAVALLGDPAYVLIEHKGRSIRLTSKRAKVEGALKLIGRPNGRYITGTQLRRLLGKDGETVKVELRLESDRLVGEVPKTVPLGHLEGDSA